MTGLVIRLSAICLVAFTLRLLFLDAQSVWWDEAISLHLATSTVADILADRAAHIHPPLYFLLLKGWIALAGTSAFSARFFSAWSNALLVPATYAFGRRWLDRRTGLLASALVAISPLYVVYSQEARVYALLPLVYLALLALANRLTLSPRPTVKTARRFFATLRMTEGGFAALGRRFFATLRMTEGRESTWCTWLLLAGIEAVGLYLHYIAILAIAYVNLLLVLHVLRQRRDLARWLTSVGLVAMLCLPWAVAVFFNRAAVLADLGAGDPFVERFPLGFFVRLLWTFQWSGLTAAPSYPPLQIATVILASLLLIGVVSLLRNDGTGATALRLVAHWLVPLGPALLMWQVKELSHPRYVAMFAIAPLILAGYALSQLVSGRAAWIWQSRPSGLSSDSRRQMGRVLAGLLGLTLCATSATALHAWYCVPEFAKDDVRGVAAWLETTTTADDRIVVPWQDWSLDYAYHGPALIVRPNPVDEATTWAALAAQTTSARRVFLVSYHRGSSDRRGLIEFALESAGSLIERRSFKGLLVRLYALDKPVEPPPQLAPSNARFGPLRLTGAWLEPGPAADTAVAIVLRWRLERPVNGRYRAALRLRDLDGWELAATDTWLLDDRALPTDRWTAGQEADTYHLLPLRPGTPPLTYTIAAGVYHMESEAVRPLDLLDAAGNPQGQSYEVGIVTLARALGLHTDPYHANLELPPLPEPAVLADGLLLEAATLDRQAAAPGQSIFVTLRWRATVAPLPELRPALTLHQAGSAIITLASAPALGRYPTDRWQAGEVVLEHRRLTIPSTASYGHATIAVGLGDRRVILGDVEILAGEHVFTPPLMAHQVYARFGDVAELLGYDLATGPYASDQAIPITLYWRALEGAANADYVVFTHLLAADGHLVAQHDGPPAAGTRPTPGWLPGEIIADRHEITFREVYSGSATIEVGLYNPASMERLAVDSRKTFVILPSSLDVAGP